jgi:putative nucleotidyltransferase with HDIG domain
VVLLLANNEQLTLKYNFKKSEIYSMGFSDIIHDLKNYEYIRSKFEGHMSFSQIVNSLPVKSSKEEQEEQIELIKNDADFTSVPLKQFCATTSILFDVFIRLGRSKYLKILRAGEAFDKNVLHRYKEKGVEYLYFSNHDRSRYVRFCDSMLERIVTESSVKVSTKVNLAQNLIEKHVEDFYLRDLKKPVLLQSKSILEKLCLLIENEKGLGDYLRTYRELDVTSYSHDFLVSLFSCSIVYNLGWKSNVTQETVGLGALFHDIGKAKLPKEIASKWSFEMTGEEYKLYQQHGIFGAEIVQSEKLINNTTMQIIMYHHETLNGMGFPQGLKNEKLPISAQIVGFSNYFADYIVAKGLNPIEGLTMLIQERSWEGKYSVEILRAFASIFVKNVMKKSA